MVVTVSAILSVFGFKIKIHFVYLEREPVIETGWPVRA